MVLFSSESKPYLYKNNSSNNKQVNTKENDDNDYNKNDNNNDINIKISRNKMKEMFRNKNSFQSSKKFARNTFH